ncbi:MAG TPA: contact-dependent growth inhibition system immunity protein [Flavobacteriaceae bacterium]|nr:contact-dependent growth inhibition system immunity protein [Flavobacteriaceae bacterium]
MKFENNWKYKSLQSLEKKKFNPLDENKGTSLIRTCYGLIRKPLIDFNIEDLRILIGQSIGLNYLIPLAIEKLKTNILVEGDYYEGDLLKMVLNSDREYWTREKENWQIMVDLFNANVNKLMEFDTTNKIRNGWFESYDEFKKINK